MSDKPSLTPTESGQGRPITAGKGLSNVARRLRSAELFQGSRELLIEHAGEDYRLRVTSKGGLILTK